MTLPNLRVLRVGMAVVLVVAIAVPWIGLVGLVSAQSNQNITCSTDSGSAQSGTSLLVLSRSLSKAEQKYKKDKDTTSRMAVAKNIADIAGQRKNLLLKEMRENPEQALLSIMLPPVIDTLKPIAGDCIEQFITIEGKLSVLHIHHIDQSGNDVHDQGDGNIFTLETNRGEKLNLHIIGELKDGLISGINLQLRGYRLDNEILVDTTDRENIKKVKQSALNPFVAEQALAEIPQAHGQQRVAVIMFNFQDGAASTVTKETIDDVVFNDVASYYNENSYGQTTITGASFGRYTIPIPSTSCNYTSVLNAAVAAADPDINYLDYDRLIITGPFNNCFTGLGTVGFGSTLTTQEGQKAFSVAWNPDAYFGPGYVGHELGHNLGLNHASMKYCGGSTFGGAGFTCSNVEYGDDYDVMGGEMSETFHMNAAHKDMIGWFDIGNALEVTSSGTHTITPIETASSGVKMIKIPRQASYDISGNPVLGYLWLEFRQPIGFDTNITPANTFSGSLVHTTIPNSTYSYLVDANVGVGGESLQSGSSITDPLTATVVQVTANSSEDVTVNVTAGKTEFTLPALSVANPTPNSAVSGIVTIEANAADDSGIEKVEFWNVGRGVLLGTDTEAPYTQDWDTINDSNGTAIIRVKAYDLSGQAYGVPGNITTSPNIGVTVANSDSSAPEISIVTPAEGSEVFTNAPVTITASSSDNGSIIRVRFYKDTATFPFATVFSAPYSISTTFTAGPHTVYAVALDNAGNHSTSTPVSITASADTLAPTVSLTSPANNSIIQHSPSTLITSEASDNDVISKVEFYADNVLIKTSTTSPYTATWNTSALASLSSHTLYTKAFDRSNNISTSTMVMVTMADISLPTVSITSPANNASVSGTVSIAASAADDAGVSKVEFYVDNVLHQTVNQTPFTATWNTASSTIGQHLLVAKAYDTSNNTATSSVITVTVADNIAPTVSVTAPANNAVVNGPVTITANASDNIGVARVEFYVDGTLIQTDTAAPFTATWNSSSTPAMSSHSIVAKAKDAIGNFASSTPVVVTIGDLIPPTISLLTPANGSQVARNTTINITATSSDNVGVTKVEFLVNNVLKCTDTVAPYSCPWLVPTPKGVQYSIKAISYDARPNSSQSSTYIVTSK